MPPDDLRRNWESAKKNCEDIVEDDDFKSSAGAGSVQQCGDRLKELGTGPNISRGLSDSVGLITLRSRLLGDFLDMFASFTDHELDFSLIWRLIFIVIKVFISSKTLVIDSHSNSGH